MKLKDQIAIVTGGAMGNGLGIVKVFLKYGATVIILDYSDELNTTLKKLNNYKNQLFAYKVDIRNEENIQKCINHIIQNHNHIDILVNNAGICNLELFANMSSELRDKHFDINIKGSWNVTKAVIPYMEKNKKGSIINLSSVTGPMVADTGEVAYATTEAALIGFTNSLAIEEVENYIRVNAILPGYILTPMVEKMAQETNEQNPQEVIDNIAKAIPMRRLGTPEEIGELAAFLACDESSYITGQTIVIDGGSTLPETNSMGI